MFGKPTLLLVLRFCLERGGRQTIQLRLHRGPPAFGECTRRANEWLLKTLELLSERFGRLCQKRYDVWTW
jgi:hypothetical protein